MIKSTGLNRESERISINTNAINNPNFIEEMNRLGAKIQKL